MRPAVLVLLALALVPGAGASPATAADRWEPGVAAARAYLERRAGVESFSLRTPRRTYGHLADRAASSASVVKAMLMVAYLRRGDVRSRALTGTDRALLEPMIRRSDNATASRIFALVGQGGLRRLGRKARMRRLATHPIWGGTQITAADQARFFERIDRYVPARHRAYAMRLLETIVPSQRWGIGRVRPAGWRLYFKGGWGSGSGAVDHQVALLERDGVRVSLAILTTDNPSMAYGSQTLEGIARRLLRGLEGTAEGVVAVDGEAGGIG